ncbi:MAG TPA: hypothetical protein VMZ53_03825 [Kofleriaceae bacterium]|nr:hypothetical protein [Kofleriaceae bacterium]
MAVPVLTGAATLNTSVLVDSLVPDVIDGLREDLHPAFGVRAYRVYRVIRSWAGKTVGEGRHTDDAAELRPQPRVSVWSGLKYVQATCGIRELGDVQLSEVSLTYTAEQLDPRTLRSNQELFYALGEANGQATPLRVWAHSAPPFIDREKTMGWLLFLRRVEAAPAWSPS